MIRILNIFFLFLLIHSNKISGQIIVEKRSDDFDSVLLSRDCKLTQKDLGKVFTKVEIIAAFPGLGKNWFEFANKNFDFDYVIQKMSDTIEKFEDSLIVKFIVTKDGNICAINYIKGNSILYDPAVKLLRLSPAWKPASSNRNLHSYRTLRIDVFIDKNKNIKEIKKYYNSYFRYND